MPTPKSVSLVPTPTSVQNLLFSNTHPSQQNQNEIWAIESQIAPTTDVDFAGSPTLQNESETGTRLLQNQGSKPNTEIHEIPSNIDIIELPTDLDWGTAFQKGTRSCTRHPISPFVSYGGLSPALKALWLNLSPQKFLLMFMKPSNARNENQQLKRKIKHCHS